MRPKRRELSSKSYLFPKLKIQLQRRRSADIANIEFESQAAMDSISKREIQGGFQQWEKRCAHRIIFKWDCFEGNSKDP
jgi:hypothetical protein